MSSRLCLVKEEKDAMAKALERLQQGGCISAGGAESWRSRDVVRTLEEQLVKERAKSQYSASKRSQEHLLLVEQVVLPLTIQPSHYSVYWFYWLLV